MNAEAQSVIEDFIREFLAANHSRREIIGFFVETYDKVIADQWGQLRPLPRNGMHRKP
jgi:hypothetical protein